MPFSTSPLLRATSSVWLMPPPPVALGCRVTIGGVVEEKGICQGRESGGILFLSPATAM